MQRKIDFSVGEYYHIYNRGTDKRSIFLKQQDYLRFKALLYICNNSDPVSISSKIRSGRNIFDLFLLKRRGELVDIGAYCLMPNHFHILIREKSEGGITKFIIKLLTAYSMYFNKKNDRRGTLFETKFKAKHLDSDEYLKYIFAYIHLNPVKIICPKWKKKGNLNLKESENFILKYSHSSYLDYINENKRTEDKILNKEVFPEYFSSKNDFKSFINEWLYFNQEKFKEELG